MTSKSNTSLNEQIITKFLCLMFSIYFCRLLSFALFFLISKACPPLDLVCSHVISDVMFARDVGIILEIFLLFLLFVTIVERPIPPNKSSYVCPTFVGQNKHSVQDLIRREFNENQFGVKQIRHISSYYYF